MEPITFQGDAFSEYFLNRLMREEPRLRGRLGEESAERAWRQACRIIRDGQRALRERQQARSTRTLLLTPLAQVMGWRLGDEETVETGEGDEAAGAPLLGPEDSVLARVCSIPPDVAFDLPPAGLHRRFAPSLSMVRALEREDLTWGLLLNAYELRLLRRAEGFVASWIGFDLTTIADGGEAGRTAWGILWALLRAEGWEATPTILDQVVDLGRDHAAMVGTGLGRQVQEAVVAVVQGILDHPANRDRLGAITSTQELQELYAQTLRVLYRLLFILYGESRGLLPLDLPTYREGYSLARLSRLATGAETDPRLGPAPAGSFFEESLGALFRLIQVGADLGPEGRIPAYGGGLFDPEGTRLLDSLRWGEATVATILDRLTFVQTSRGKVRLSYRELDVEQLGAIYEGLLERTLEVAREPLWPIRLDDQELYVTGAQRAELAERRGEILAEGSEEGEEERETADEEPEEAEGEDEPEEEGADEPEPVASHRKPIRILRPAIPPGRVFLRGGLGRKQTGSYYTNRAFVGFLVRRAVDPLAEGKAPDEILALRVCDLAMGSGHFLVGACRRLAEHLLAAYREQGQEEAHPEVARVWDDEERALAACRLLVAGNCLYGVDRNPLAVELARVSLWLATAATDHPLTFLDHRLRIGDSLLGLPLYLGEGPEPPTHLLQANQPRVARRGRRRNAQEAQGTIPVDAGAVEIITSVTRQLRERLRRAFNSLQEIRRLVDDNPGDFAGQRAAFTAMQGELAPFLELHALRIGRSLGGLEETVADLQLMDAWLRDLARGPVSEAAREAGGAALAHGRESRAFCWPLEFPDVFFEPSDNGQGVRPRGHPGFDAMIGNPPWEKVITARKEFYEQADPAIRDYQGQNLARRIAELHQQQPDLANAWTAYESREKRYAGTLLRGGLYQHQIAEVRGDKTGGHPDLFKFFLERNHQLTRIVGRVGMLLPAGIYAVEGCTGLRRLLFHQARVESLFSFENHLERFFPGVDSRQKFITLVFAKEVSDEASFLGAFMLRDEGFLSLPPGEQDRRGVRISPEFIRLTNPDNLALVEVKSAQEQAMVERIYRTIPPLGHKLEESWNISFTQEVNMTSDSYLFGTREWLRAHGCALFVGGRMVEGPADAQFQTARPGGQYWFAPAASWYDQQGGRFVQARRYVIQEGSRVEISIEPPPAEDGENQRRRRRSVQVLEGYVLAEREDDPTELPVCPDGVYVPLYEGRMVHQFDHAAKTYLSGEGRGAEWDELSFRQKVLVPHFFIQRNLGHDEPNWLRFRPGFCDVTGQTNERSVLAAVLPAGHPAGHSVPTVGIQGAGTHAYLFWVAVATSFVAEFLIRQKISTHLSFFYLESWPFPRLAQEDLILKQLAAHAARLSCFTPEMGALWEEVADRLSLREQRSTTDLRERARLRAEIDAIIADLYGLSVAEFAYILTTFPLLDRDQPPLPGDFFVRWNKKGQPKFEPRSFATRDTALLAFMRRKNVTSPADLAAFYRGEIGVDFDSDRSQFRLGPIRNLEARVEEAFRRGAIAYVPSQARRFNPSGPYQPPDLPPDWESLIVRDISPGSHCPSLRGSQIEIARIVEILEEGGTFSQICGEHPSLTPSHIAAALQWRRESE